MWQPLTEPCHPRKMGATLVYGKACHLPIELEHRAYWAIKQLNFSLDKTGERRKLQLNELEEIRHDAYD